METTPFHRLSSEQMTCYRSAVIITLMRERKHAFAGQNNKAAEVLAKAFTVKSGWSIFFLLSTFWFHVWYHTVVYTQHVSKIQFVLTLCIYHHWTSVGQHGCQKQQPRLSFASLFLLLLSLVHMKRETKPDLCFKFSGKSHQFLALWFTAKPQKHL